MFDRGGAFALSARTKAAMDAHTTAVIRIPIGFLLIIALVYAAASMEKVPRPIGADPFRPSAFDSICMMRNIKEQINVHCRNQAWLLKKSLPAKFAKIKSRQDALQTTFSVFLDIFY